MINTKKATIENIIKQLKTEDKGKIVKGGREGGTLKLGEQLNITANFTSVTMEATRQWNDIFNGRRKKARKSRVLYKAKNFFKMRVRHFQP